MTPQRNASLRPPASASGSTPASGRLVLEADFGERVVAEVGDVLAGVLSMEAARIDLEQNFQVLGIDSILGVEFVSLVNARFGTDIKSTELYDHPTPAAFGRHVAARLGGGVPQKPVSQQAVPAPAPAPSPAVSAPTVTPAQPKALAPQNEDRVGSVLRALRQRLAETLCCDVWDIDPEAGFITLGLDSILGVEFVAFLNNAYGLDEKVGVLYDHPSLSALAAYVAARTAPAPAPADAAGTGGGISTQDLDVLLAAVREHRLTLEQALAFLPQQG